MTTTPSAPADERPALQDAVRAQDAALFLLLAWRSTSPDYRAELVDLEGEVSDQFLNYAIQVAGQLTQRTEIPYDPEWPLRDYEYFSLQGGEYPTTNLFDQLLDFQNLQTFKRKNLTKPKLYVVAVQSSGQTAFFGKRMANLRVLKKKAGALATVWDGSTFNILETSVATFSTSFDWVLWQGRLYILDANGFHAEFRDMAALQSAVVDQMTSITDKVGIVNSATMTARCQSDFRMASKLKRIAERGLHLSSTIAELKQYARDFSIAVAWQGDELVFDESIQGQWNILKLLDEDHTEGPVTHRHYESAAKREI